MTPNDTLILPLAQQLQNLITKYKGQMTNHDQSQLLAIMQSIETFLKQNEPLIMEQCAMNGYSNQSPDWTQHYAAFLKGTIAAIQFDQNPANQPFDPNLIFENLTQLHFLMVTPLKG